MTIQRVRPPAPGSTRCPAPSDVDDRARPTRRPPRRRLCPRPSEGRRPTRRSVRRGPRHGRRPSRQPRRSPPRRRSRVAAQPDRKLELAERVLEADRPAGAQAGGQVARQRDRRSAPRALAYFSGWRICSVEAGGFAKRRSPPASRRWPEGPGRSSGPGRTGRAAFPAGSAACRGAPSSTDRSRRRRASGRAPPGSGSGSASSSSTGWRPPSTSARRAKERSPWPISSR